MFEGGMDATQPTDPIQTVRLVLTPVDAEDVDDLALLYGDPIVALWTGPWTRASIEAFVVLFTVQMSLLAGNVIGHVRDKTPFGFMFWVARAALLVLATILVQATLVPSSSIRWTIRDRLWCSRDAR